MSDSIWLGIFCVLVGGVMTASFAVPMKLARYWTWETTWLVYSVVALALVPAIAAAISVPHLATVLASVPGRTLAITASFGFGWGIANVLFGLAVPRVGMALSFSIVVGMSAALGSLIPLIVLQGSRLRETS